MTEPIKILLVDDHAIVREGYRRLLESEPSMRIVGEAGDAEHAWQRARALRPDVVVMDIALPGMSGIEATRRLIKEQPQLRVLIFSMYDDAIYASRALEAGALGYLSKVSAPEVLVAGRDRNIGTTLGLSEKTVANQQWALRAKLGARNSAQLALLAAKIGLSR